MHNKTLKKFDSIVGDLTRLTNKSDKQKPAYALGNIFKYLVEEVEMFPEVDPFSVTSQLKLALHESSKWQKRFALLKKDMDARESKEFVRIATSDRIDLLARNFIKGDNNV